MRLNYSSIFSLAMASSIVMLSACEKDEERLTASDKRDIAEEAIIDAYYQDLDDLGAVALASPSNDEFSGGRKSATITIEDERLGCDGIIITIEPGVNSTPEQPYGELIIDFGTTGCADLKGNIRKGKLIFAYDGRRFLAGSTVTLTTENYSINGIKLEGVRTSTNITEGENDPPKFHVVLTDGKATFPDNSIAYRESDITWSWVREANPSQDKLIIHSNSTAGGITRAGREYSVSLLAQLEYKRFCGIPVTGIKKYMIDGDKEISIDYGVGECDNSVSVTIDGVTRTVTVG